jgi:hypothetical protein
MKAEIHCAHDEVWPLEKLVENPRNPNKHPAEQLRLLGKVIVTTGWRQAIVVSRRSGFVVKGHGRLQAARLAGLEEAPVDVQDYASEAEEWADMVADNRLAELAEMSLPDLKGLLSELKDAGTSGELAGFTDIELERVLRSFDVEGKNDTGEVWQGMPACDAENQLAINLTIYFQTVEDKVAFGKLIEQPITADTKSKWYPKRNMDQLGTKQGIVYGKS